MHDDPGSTGNAVSALVLLSCRHESNEPASHFKDRVRMKTGSAKPSDSGVDRIVAVQSHGRPVCEPARRIVVIDDERIIADTLTLILRRHGYDAKAHYRGESAIASIEAFRPQIVLSDICLPGLDGIETAVKIKELQPRCRIILFTATPERHEIRNRINELGFEFLQRPLHPSEILRVLCDAPRPAPPFEDRLSQFSNRCISAGATPR